MDNVAAEPRTVAAGDDSVSNETPESPSVAKASQHNTVVEKKDGEDKKKALLKKKSHNQRKSR